MAEQQQEAQPQKEKVNFQLIKQTKLDRKGRFYLPGSLVDNLFAGIPEDEREVEVYLGAGGRLLLLPVK